MCRYRAAAAPVLQARSAPRALTFYSIYCTRAEVACPCIGLAWLPVGEARTGIPIRLLRTIDCAGAELWRVQKLRVLAGGGGGGAPGCWWWVARWVSYCCLD